MNIDNDFGFTLADEETVKAHERKIIQEKTLSETAAKTKAEGLIKMIMPLLDSLSQDPEKHYILWPDRSKRVTEFKTKLLDYYNS